MDTDLEEAVERVREVWRRWHRTAEDECYELDRELDRALEHLDAVADRISARR
jgi:hypothetical protein